MSEAPEDDTIEKLPAPVRVPVTPQWKKEQAEKQERYRSERTAWMDRDKRPKK